MNGSHKWSRTLEIVRITYMRNIEKGWVRIDQERKWHIKKFQDCENYGKLWNGGNLWTSLVVQMVKLLSTMRETWVQSLGWEDPLEKEMAIHSSTIAWKIPWTEEPGRLQSTGSQRVRHDWVTSLSQIWRAVCKLYDSILWEDMMILIICTWQ